MLIDNKVDRYPDDGLGIKTVWEFINKFSGKESGQKGKLDIVTGYFTIRALSQLYREIPEDDEFRIVSSEMVRTEQQLEDIKDLLNGDFSIETQFQLDQYAKEAKAFLERNSVQIKAIANAFCHAKVYTFKNLVPLNSSYYLTGSSNLTDAGLGLKTTSNVEMTIGENVSPTDSQFKEVCKWFEDIWKKAQEKIEDPENPSAGQISVKDYFIRMIEDYFHKYTPEEIYYKILFELFNADLDIDSSIEHEKEMSLLQTSVIWKTLFNYQQKGVISLIKMLRKYNGAILADAVGLGKTFSALAVIKYFQTQNYLTVLLCPKKLEENWTQYLRRHGSRFDRDEFDYVVRFHTDLQNDRLETSYNDATLSYIQNRPKVLLVIDESHNLRNEKSNRYQELLTKVIQGQSSKLGHQLKVLMLSATPINTGLNDIKGQFNLIGKGDDAAFAGDDFGVESLKNLFIDSQSKYTSWCNNPDRTIGSLIAKLQPKFFNLTDKLIVARTRKLIERILDEDLGFPAKKAPINEYKGVDHFGDLKTTKQIHDALMNLHLTAYQPSLYLTAKMGEAEKGAKEDWESNVNRERFLVSMMVMLFMKRLESSWYSCMLTIKKVLDVHERTLQLVKDFKEKKANGTLPADENDWDDDEVEEYALRKGEIRLNEMKNLKGFEKGLSEDVIKLRSIYNALLDFQQKYKSGNEKDEKLEKLIEILYDKQQKENKKVVIFTAYTDTARFLFEELTKRGFSKMAYVSGIKNETTGNQQTAKFTEILQCFAPYSKLYKELDWRNLYEDAELDYAKYYNDEKDRWEVDYEKWQKLIKKHRPRVSAQLDDDIDILIATDCLSEGQNLQDADMQINYDIHWNPVRLIQRFGRIDRLGSPNKVVQCVNFWPASSFEEYLKLEKRIMDRMTIMNLTGAETQELNEGYLKMIEDNPLIDKHADALLAQLQNESISDIESPQTLTLKDFSFEIYRQDLIEYFEQNKETFRKMPNGIFTGFRTQDTLFEHIPESLVAVVGYPRREHDSKKPYTELYLMCQPVDTSLPATYQELNRAEILELLRKNKRQDRFVPEWIETSDNTKLQKLQEIIRAWMRNKAPQQAKIERKDRFHSKGTAKKKSANEESLDKKFQMENFDLIVWEYVSK